MVTLVVSTKAEAEVRAQQIRNELEKMEKIVTEGLGPLLAEAHEREDWVALGFASWQAYVESFGLTRRRSYQLLDQAHVESGLSAILGEPVRVSERAAREVKGSVVEVGRKALSERARGVPAQKAADTAVAAVRTSAYQQALEEQQRADAQRGGPIAKPGGGKGRSYAGPTEQLRRWTETAEGWRDQMDGEPIDPDFARAGRRLAALFVEMFGLD